MNRKLAALLAIPPIIIGIILLLFGGLLTDGGLFTELPSKGEQSDIVHMQLIIDYQGFAPNEEYNLSLPPDKQTVYHAMVLAGLNMETTGSGALRFVEAINGIRNNQDGNNHWWQFWVDGELAPVGVGSYVVSEGAVVEWRYTQPQMS